jgi:hypothetical protein
MPLTNPIDEEIFQAVATRLASVASATVKQYRREPGNWTPEDRQICVVRKNPERAPDLDYPGNPPALAYKMTVNLRLHIQQSETDTDNNSELVSTFAADVHECVCGVANWYQWGSKAIDTDFGTTEYPSPSGSFDVAVIPLVITYRHSEGDPYEVR